MKNNYHFLQAIELLISKTKIECSNAYGFYKAIILKAHDHDAKTNKKTQEHKIIQSPYTMSVDSCCVCVIPSSTFLRCIYYLILIFVMLW